MIKINIDIGDEILVGRFKNKRIKVKEIGKNEHDIPTINGRPILTFRFAKKTNESKTSLKKLIKELL